MSQWVPTFTSEAGLCLTALNWQEVNIHTAVYYLDALLLKPGLELLKKITDFSLYMNSPNRFILNASRLKVNKEGNITLISSYDGSKIQLHDGQLIDLIHHLKPQAVLLPPDINKNNPDLWRHWHPDIMPFLSIRDLDTTNVSLEHGVYFAIGTEEFPRFKELLLRHRLLPSYALGSFSLEQIQELKDLGIHYIESDEPVRQGMRGMVYSDAGLIDIKEERFALHTELLHAHCRCPTCVAGLTKAYLHHLLGHTPLLCQRFLIQHNVWHLRQ